KITKGDIVSYYNKVAKYMVPHLRERPLVVERFPDGIKAESFYQKAISSYFPKWIDRVKIKRRSEGTKTYVVCNDAESLVYLANQACLVLHTWLSRRDRLEFPDMFILDLDPPSADAFDKVRRFAFIIRGMLNELKVPSYVKLTGSRGLHVAVPLDRSCTF